MNESPSGKYNDDQEFDSLNRKARTPLDWLIEAAEASPADSQNPSFTRDLQIALRLLGLPGFLAWRDPQLPEALKSCFKNATSQEQRSAAAWLLAKLSEDVEMEGDQDSPKSS